MFNIVDGRGSGSYKALHMEKKRRPRAYREGETLGLMWYLTQMDSLLLSYDFRINYVLPMLCLIRNVIVRNA